MKAIIRGNEKVVIRVFINKGEGWQYIARPEDPNKISAAQIVDYVNTGKGNKDVEELVLSLQGELAHKTIHQLLFDTHQMEKILADIFKETEDEAVKEEIRFLEDLYASKYPLTQNPDTDKITPEDKEKFDGMEKYSEVLVAYIVSGLIKTGLLNFTAKLKK